MCIRDRPRAPRREGFAKDAKKTCVFGRFRGPPLLSLIRVSGPARRYARAGAGGGLGSPSCCQGLCVVLGLAVALADGYEVARWPGSYEFARVHAISVGPDGLSGAADPGGDGMALTP